MDFFEEKPKPELSCFYRGPGPTYKLPSLIGYINHDPSRRREPAYSINVLKRTTHIGDGPGPKYNIGGFTNRGPDKSPAYSIGQKKPVHILYTGPSPMDYEAEKCPLVNHSHRPPAYSLKSRDVKRVEVIGPGPIYLLPTCIGPNVIDKKAQAAFTIGIRTKKDRWDDIPGPGTYRTKNYDVVKRRIPAYSLKFRLKDLAKWTGGPGPKYKSEFYSGKRAPMYTFGTKHSKCAGTPLTEADLE